jgi:phage/plasmid-like protein (TIGR03299 family)
MSKETSVWLNQNTLIGFTDQRGHAWHYRASDQGAEPNHYTGPVPVADVERRLFHWEAQRCAIHAVTPDGSMVDIPERQAIVRSDTGTVLGIFSDGYQPHAYREWLLGNVANLLDDGLSIGSAGLLDGGGIAWVSVEVPETFSTPEGVDFRPHLLATTSFNGKVATTYKRTVTLTVCDNTLAAALRENGQQFKVKHTRRSVLRLAEARQALNLIYESGDAFAAEVKHLCETAVTDRQWAAFLDVHVPIPDAKGNARTIAERKRGELVKLWTWDGRVAPWKNTAFGVLQAANTYDQHVGTVRNVNARAERNMLNAIDGTTDKNDAEVLHTLGAILDRPLAAAV